MNKGYSKAILFVNIIVFSISCKSFRHSTTKSDGTGLIAKGKTITFDKSLTFQTIDGFGGGIKRGTRDLYTTDSAIRDKVEKLCFKDLDVNMIRFFVYSGLQPSESSTLDWKNYESDPADYRSRYVAEALKDAMALNTDGFDYIIGNCNSAPAWLKSNDSSKNGGHLIPGGEEKYSKFLTAFLQGMKNRYGIHVTDISPANEPDYHVRYTSMDLTPEQMDSMVTNLHRQLIAKGMNTKIISPACFRVNAGNGKPVGTTYYIKKMFANPSVREAVDVVATHTYADLNNNANWKGLKMASDNKPVWVTESAVLKPRSSGMSNAEHYIKWMINGFNKGGMTAYMVHVFYGKSDGGPGVALVMYTNNEVIVPKRYYAFKQFANYIHPGFKRIALSVSRPGLMGSAFVSPGGKKVVIELWFEGQSRILQPIALPHGVTSVSHYITSDVTEDNAKSLSDISFVPGNDTIKVDMPPMSLHTIVLNF